MDTIATKYDEVQSNGSSDDLKVNEKTTVAELAAVLHSRAQSDKGPGLHRRTETKGFAFHSSESKQPRVFCKLDLDAEVCGIRLFLKCCFMCFSTKKTEC